MSHAQFISRHVKRVMDSVFGGRWLCIAGRNFSAELTPGAQRFALFRTPAYAVTVFQLPHVLRPVNRFYRE